MPSTHTKQLIKWVQLNANGWNRTGSEGILPILDSVQNILLQNETAQNLLFDSTTGDFPSLDTENEVYEYDMPSNVWRVSEVLLTSPIPNDLNLDLNPEYGLVSNINPAIEKKFYNNREYQRFPFVSTRDQNPREVCKVRFHVNPTTTTGSFLYRGYKMITPRLTSESVEIQIAEKYDFTVTMPVINLVIQAFQTGNWDETIELIEKLYKPKLIKEMNAGEQGELGFIRRREF
jgi:hypothetical protein